MLRQFGASAPTVPRTLPILALILLFSILQGCTASPWEENYEGASTGSLPKDTPVQLRDVSWDRLQSGLKDLEAEEARSDIHPSDWPPEKKAEFNARLLKILQLSDDPARTEILGRSAFRTTTPRIPNRDPDLSDFARKLGATTVIWSRRLTGKADQIVQEPVTTFAIAHGWGRHDSAFSETYTTWVPVVVQSDEYAYVAYFLRSGS